MVGSGPAARPLRAPSKLLWAAELPRALYGLGTLAASRRRLAAVPPGDGRPILILPGLGNADFSNVAMRRYLDRIGYDARGWGFGFNRGARTIGPDGERLEALIRDVHDETGQKVTLIGVSLGGMMARMMAHRLPDLVREVITVSAPFAGDPRATNVWRAFEWLTGERVTDPAVADRRAALAAPLPVPATAIWSASDGLVNGVLCRAPGERDIEIRSSHLGVQTRPEALRAIAETLGGAAR